MRYLATETVPVGALEAYPGNARVHDEPALDESARTNGQYRSVVARRLEGGALQLLAGHGTVGAFRRQGAGEVRVEVIEADDTEARRIVLADNGTSRGASYDESLLLDLLDAASKDGGLGGTGWDGEAYKELLDAADEGNPFDFDPSGDADEDAELEPPADPVTQPGDVWLLGSHRIICGDCRDPQVVASLLAGAKVNVAFTSPPYASQRKYDETSGFKPIHPDEYVDWFDGVQANVREHLAEDGSWFVNIKPNSNGLDTELYVLDLVLAHARRWGWHFATEFCWERNGTPGIPTRRFKNQFEPIYQFALGDWKFRPLDVRHSSENVPVYDPANRVALDKSGGQGQPGYGFKPRRANRSTAGMAEMQGSGADVGAATVEGLAYPGNRLPTLSGSHTATGHAAAFPVGLPQFFIKAYSDMGDSVYDPFMGSGSTLLAAEQEGRTAYGSEISPGYCDVIARRYQDLTGDMPVLERTGERFDFHGADGPVAVAA